MENERILDDIKNAIVNLEPDTVCFLVEKALDTGIPALKIVKEGLSSGLTIVGEKWEKREYFLVEVLTAIHCMNKAFSLLGESIKKEEAGHKSGIVLIGTVEGDMHDIGKNIVTAVLEAAGFEVHDLGVNVSASKFVEKVKEIQPDILGLSALLTTTYPFMKDVIDALREAGLRDDTFVIIGGNPVNERVAKEFGADAYAKDALEAQRILLEFMRKKSEKKN